MTGIRKYLFVICWSCAVTSYRLEPAKMKYKSAKSNCTLATPRILYADMENKVDLGTFNGLIQGEKVWVGYTRDYAVFSFLGCFFKDNITILRQYTTRHDIGICKSACDKTDYFGVQIVGAQVADCYCIASSDLDLGAPSSCGLSEYPNEFVFGSTTNSQSFVAIYRLVRKDTTDFTKYPSWTSLDDKCFCYSRQNSFNALKFEWLSCSTPLPFICSEGVNGSSGYLFDTENGTKSWNVSVNLCLDKGHHPVDYNVHFGVNDIGDNVLWLSDVKSLLISDNTDDNDSATFPQIEEKTNQSIDSTTNTEATSTNYDVFSSSTQNTRSIQEHTSQANTVEATKMSASINTRHTSQGTTDLSTSNSADVEYEERDDIQKVAWFIGIPVVVFLIGTVAIITVVLCRKRQKSNKAKRSTKTTGALAYNHTTLKLNKTNTTFNDGVNIAKGEIEETAPVDFEVTKGKRGSEPTRNNVNDNNYFILEKLQPSEFRAAKYDDWDQTSETSGQTVQDHTYSVPMKTKNVNRNIPQKEKGESYDYAKVMPRRVVKKAENASYISHRGCETGTDTDYDHLGQIHVTNTYLKGKYQDGDAKVEHIYNKTSSNNAVDTYDHINNRVGGPSRSQLRNNDHSQIYNRLNSNDDTYTYVKSSTYRSCLEQPYNTTKVQNVRTVGTDNLYDHTS